jgi:hypothetical protein
MVILLRAQRPYIVRNDFARPGCRDHQRLTVSVAAVVTVARFAEIVTSVVDFGRLVDTVTCARVAPAATAMPLGTAAMLGGSLDSLTVNPPGGAAPLRVMVAVDGVPPRTLLGLKLIETRAGAGATVSAAD